MTINLPGKVKNILQKLQDNGYEGYAVGGAVRDSLLKKNPKDWDITTNALPDDIIKIFNNYQIVLTGIKHGTVGVVIRKELFEITTYRTDNEYLDNRHPSSVTFSKSLKDDLSRRDFTINALFCDINGNVGDYFNGINDLKNKKIVCVGDASSRFNEDALRILRAIRFASTLEFSIDEETKKAIFKNKSLLLNISSERVQSELNGILTSNCFGKIVNEYDFLFSLFIPNLLEQKDIMINNKSLWMNTLEMLFKLDEGLKEKEVREKIVLKLLGIFLNTGIVLENKNCLDKESLNASAIIAMKSMEKLKYSKEQTREVCWLISNLGWKFDCSKISAKKLLHLSPMSEYVYMMLEFLMTVSSDKDFYNVLIKTKENVDFIINDKEAYNIKMLDINGHDLMNDLNIDGEIIGEALNYLLDKVIDEKVSNDKKCLEDYLKENYLKEYK